MPHPRIRKPTRSERAELEHYLRLDQEALLLTLEWARPETKAKPFRATAAVGRTQNWLIEHTADLHARICTEWKYCERRSSERLADKFTLLVTLGDVLAESFVGFPPLLIAALVFKIGLDSFCNCDE